MEFTRLLWFEQCCLLETLVNNDSSSGVPRVAQQDVLRDNTAEMLGLKSALYDTLVLSYLCGMLIYLRLLLLFCD